MCVSEPFMRGEDMEVLASSGSDRGRLRRVGIDTLVADEAQCT